MKIANVGIKQNTLFHSKEKEMVPLKEADIFNMSLFLLRCIGVDPLANYGIIFIINVPVIFGVVVVFTVLLFRTFLQAEGDVQTLALSLNSLTIYYQVFNKNFNIISFCNFHFSWFRNYFLFFILKNKLWR